MLFCLPTDGYTVIQSVCGMAIFKQDDISKDTSENSSRNIILNIRKLFWIVCPVYHAHRPGFQETCISSENFRCVIQKLSLCLEKYYLANIGI